MGTLTIYYNSTSTSRYTENRTSYPSIYYNSTSTLRFTFSPSVTSKEIGCAGKVMRSNLVIGGKTIACSGKMMRTNVKATYAPALSKSTPTALSGALNFCVGTSIASSYAIFAGKGSVVNAYNASLTRSICTALDTNGLYSFAGSKVGNYGLFGGGYSGVTYSKVYAYNTSLTRSLPSELVQISSGLAGGYNSSYAVFTGGFSGKTTAYNSSLTRSAPTAHETRYGIAGTGIGSYALFAGGGSSSGSGSDNDFYSDAVAYNTSLTKSTPTALSARRKDFAAAPNSAYAIFAGGYGTYNSTTGFYYDDNVDAYNTSLTRTVATKLRAARSDLSAAGNYGYVICAGGILHGNYTYGTDTADAYNASLTRSSATALGTARSWLGGASVGNYALFAGGENTSGAAVTNVDAYGYA